MRLQGFCEEIRKLHTESKGWQCFHCQHKWMQSTENGSLCSSCSRSQLLAFAVPTGRVRIVIGVMTMETKKKVHFDHLNQAVEIPITLKNMERSGRLNTPEKRNWARGILEQSKNHKVIDYQVHGHPTLDDKEFKHPDFERIE